MVRFAPIVKDMLGVVTWQEDLGYRIQKSPLIAVGSC